MKQTPSFTVWFLIFGAVISLITVFIKIIMEFPGLLKFKCIYREQSAEDDFQEVGLSQLFSNFLKQ